MHMIKIEHLLKANLYIDQLKLTFNWSNNVRTIVANHVQQSFKYAYAHILHVLKKQFHRVNTTLYIKDGK